MNNIQKKKILLFCCNGGGGHVSVARAIASYLTEYTIVIENDPFFFFSPGKLSGADIYNWLLRHNTKRLLNVLYDIGWMLLKLNTRSMHTFIKKRIVEEKPDLIISVIPFVNELAARVAQELSIPFVLVPTDLNIDSFIRDITTATSSSIIVCTSFSDEEQKKKLLQKGVLPSNIYTTGFPLRRSFYERKDTKKIKQSLGLTQDIPIVAIIMGATGSTAMIDYLQAVQQSTISCYSIACIGRNKTLTARIKSAPFFSEQIHILDDTYDMADIMAVADLCITKPGSVTFCEAVYMNIPILLDQTSPVLLWEGYNCTFLERYNLGKTVTSFDQVAALVTLYLNQKRVRSQIRSVPFAECYSTLPGIINQIVLYSNHSYCTDKKYIPAAIRL